MTIKAVVFDFADTLVHTERFDYDACLKTMVESFRKNGVSVPFESFRRGYFDSRDTFYKRTEKTLEEQDFGERIAETMKFCGFKLSADDKRIRQAKEAFCMCFAQSLTIDDYLPPLLDELHRKYKLAIVSNMSFAQAILQSVRDFAIADYFDTIVVSGILGWRKPSPRIFDEVLRALHVKAEEAAFVGDSPRADVEGAKQVGMKALLLRRGSGKEPVTDTAQFYMRENKSRVKPDRTIRKLANLPRALQSLRTDKNTLATALPKRP